MPHSNEGSDTIGGHNRHGKVFNSSGSRERREQHRTPAARRQAHAGALLRVLSHARVHPRFDASAKRPQRSHRYSSASIWQVPSSRRIALGHRFSAIPHSSRFSTVRPFSVRTATAAAARHLQREYPGIATSAPRLAFTRACVYPSFCTPTRANGRLHAACEMCRLGASFLLFHSIGAMHDDEAGPDGEDASIATNRLE